MEKYRKVKNMINGERAIIISSTSEVVTEKGQPERYKDLRKKSIDNMIKRTRNEILSELCGTSARQAKMDMGL